ncbi:protein D2-like [Uranotaenia lowii]|uniref:protein D2-like n=1 Tax=Uranotaenia lowii TaxID=190385 RepID=UPI00247AD699|nr:protein D2-like [Uranotaenia lowii]
MKILSSSGRRSWDLVVVVFVGVALASGFRSEDVAESFTSNEIVPDVIAEPPQAMVQVLFPSGAKVEMGNELTPTQVKDKPMLDWKVDDGGTLYTLILTDPDAPSRANPKMREWKHWLVVNIPGVAVSKGTVLADFVSSAPPQASGLHRYVFLVYKQPGKINPDEPVLSKHNPNRAQFQAAEFAEKYNLGSPIAGNFYQAQYDDHVPQVYASLTEHD